jgi:hypothetical protein
MSGGPRDGEADFMLTIGIQNLQDPLARAQTAYRDGTARLAPANADRLARRAVDHGPMTASYASRGARRGPGAQPV